MDLLLKPNESDNKPINVTLPVPVSIELKNEVEKLKRIYGKQVNDKARAFFQALVDENKRNQEAS